MKNFHFWGEGESSIYNHPFHKSIGGDSDAVFACKPARRLKYRFPVNFAITGSFDDTKQTSRCSLGIHQTFGSLFQYEYLEAFLITTLMSGKRFQELKHINTEELQKDKIRLSFHCSSSMGLRHPS